jgi:hypothetical protein
MKSLVKVLVLASTLFLLSVPTYAQETASSKDEKTKITSPAGKEDLPSAEVVVLQQRKSFLETRLATLQPSSQDYLLTEHWIREIEGKIEELKREETISTAATEPNLVAVSKITTTSVLSSQTNSAAQVQTEPDFLLSRPEAGATNELTGLVLAWTEDHPCPTLTCPPVLKNYQITKFIVEIAINKTTISTNRFLQPIFVKEVTSDGESAESITVPKDILQSGQKYHWQVFAEYVPQGSNQPLTKAASNAPRSFKTEAQTFAALENKGLTLQRAVSGNDATEGAEFGFLKTFNKNTVYTADFALIYNKQFVPTQRTSYAFQASVQGSLSSDDSESEDALQFRVGAIIDRNLKRGTLNGLYLSLAAKYESDQKFKIGKFISENMLTPTFPKLGIGIPFGRPSQPVQFRWRPFFYLDAGHTFNRGDSEETEDTILRLTPRVRAMLTLNFLRRALNLNDTFIYVDDYFYYSPLEKMKKQHNMLTSGFSLQVTKNFGFGLTYKNGEAAPKFKRVNTFGGVLTIRFGKEED